MPTFNTISPNDWKQAFAAHRSGKWPNTLAQQIHNMTIDNITDEMVVAWFKAKAEAYGCEVGFGSGYHKHFFATNSEWHSEFAETLLEAVEQLKSGAKSRAARLRADAEKLLAQAEKLEAAQ